MAYDNLVERLKRDYEETVDHIWDGNHRIVAWYCDGVEPPAGFPELEKAPHQRLLEEGVELLELASGELNDPTHRLSGPIRNAQLILYGVGFERIGSAIHLKLQTAEFIEELLDSGETPNFWKSWEVVRDNLSERLDEKQVKAVKWTQEIVWKHRNNEAHLGYHRHLSYQYGAIVLDVASKIVRHYTEENFEALETLQVRSEKWRRRDEQGIFWDVEFDEEYNLV